MSPNRYDEILAAVIAYDKVCIERANLPELHNSSDGCSEFPKADHCCWRGYRHMCRNCKKWFRIHDKGRELENTKCKLRDKINRLVEDNENISKADLPNI